MDTKLSTRLKSLRKNLSYSTEKVTKLLKEKGYCFSKQSIYKWENGSAVPNINVIRALASIYQCNLSYLLNGKIYEYKRITPKENILLSAYRTDFFFRSISMQLIRKFNQ